MDAEFTMMGMGGGPRKIDVQTQNMENGTHKMMKNHTIIVRDAR